jgi:ABC-2 type transport system ATP-binding protein
MQSTPAIAVNGLTVIRGGNVVLNALNAAVERGSVVGLLGPSGCGKTTLIRSIAGIQIVEAGRVSVLGAPAGSPSLRRRVAYMPQTLSVYPDLTVTENLRYYARIVGAPSRRVADILETVDLSPFASRQVLELSGGQRARVSLALALIGEPEVMLLDEPTVGLDPVLRMELWRRFHELAGVGTTLLITSHVMDEADRCDRLLLMREGLILAEDTPDGLRKRTGKDRFEDAFLALIEAEP